MTQLWRASLAGAAAFALAWLASRTLFRGSPRLRAWTWRLAFAKLLVSFVVAGALGLPALPRYEAPAPAPKTASAPVAAPMAGPAAAAPVEPRFTFWPHALLALWALGAAIGCVRAVRSWRHSVRLRVLARPATEAEARELLGEAAMALELVHPPALAWTSAGTSPMLCGLRSPTILVPESMRAGAPGDLKGGLASMAIREGSAHVILETLAINSKADFIADDRLPPRNVSLVLDEINATEAMNLVADVCGYGLEQRFGHDGRVTYIVRATR